MTHLPYVFAPPAARTAIATFVLGAREDFPTGLRIQRD